MKRIINKANIFSGVIIVITAFLLLSFQIFAGKPIIGYDTFFHFNRIYDTAMQLDHHTINYFMSNYGYSQSGQIVNAVYGPYMAYFLGFLLLITHNWFWFQIISDLILLLVGGLGAFLLFRRLNLNHFLATTGAIIFISQNFFTFWITSTAFLDWGVMLLPYALMIALNLADGSPKRIHYTLGLIVALLLEMHVLSAVITILMFLPFFLVGMIRSHERLQYLKRIFLNILLAMVLAANYLVAFVNVFFNNQLVPPFTVSNLQEGGMQFIWDNSLQTGIGLVFIFIIVAQIFLIIINTYREKLNMLITTVGLVFFSLSSDSFPWNTIGKQIPILQEFLQFPSRFWSVAALLLLTGFLMSLHQLVENSTPRLQKNTYYAFAGFLAILAIIIGTGNVRQQLNNNWQVKHNEAPQKRVYAKHLLPYGFYAEGVTGTSLAKDFRSSNLRKPLDDDIRGVTDYLPNETKKRQPDRIQEQYTAQIMANNPDFKRTVPTGGQVQLTWNNDQQQMQSVPQIVYANSKVELNGQRLTKKNTQYTDEEHFYPKHYQTSDIGALYVPAKVGKNVLSVSYDAPKYVNWGITISVISWLSLVGYFMFRGFLKIEKMILK